MKMKEDGWGSNKKSSSKYTNIQLKRENGMNEQHRSIILELEKGEEEGLM
jgi:hypothetical protein